MQQERRRFFRINDWVGVAYRPAAEGEVARVNVEQGVRDPLVLIAILDHELREQLVAVEGRDPETAAALTTLNEKLDCVIDHLTMSRLLMEQVAARLQEVSISACGMAFWADERFDPGSWLHLELTLEPKGAPLLTLGEVVGCEASAEGKYYLRVDFRGLGAADQERLIQHLVQRQGSQLRRGREGGEPGAESAVWVDD